MGSWFSRTSFNPERDLLDMRGKVVLITGANTGIGMHTAKHLVRRGATVYLCSRDESKATGAIAALEAEGLGSIGGKVVFHRVDLSDPREAKRCADAFVEREGRLDVLINNAAMLKCVREKSSDGILQSMITNHISPFVFTQTLLPLLRKTAASDPQADVRIINTSSHIHSDIPKDTRFRSVSDFNETCDPLNTGEFKYGLQRYGRTKLANILYANELHRRLAALSPPLPITAFSIHPGVVNTFADKLPLPYIVAYVFLWLWGTTPDVGAYTSAWAAASPDPRWCGGKYVGPVGVQEVPSELARDDGLMRELWATTERLVEELGINLPRLEDAA